MESTVEKASLYVIVPVTNELIRGQLVNSLVRRKQCFLLTVPVIGSSGVTKMDVIIIVYYYGPYIIKNGLLQG